MLIQDILPLCHVVTSFRSQFFNNKLQKKFFSDIIRKYNMHMKKEILNTISCSLSNVILCSVSHSLP